MGNLPDGGVHFVIAAIDGLSQGHRPLDRPFVSFFKLSTL